MSIATNPAVSAVAEQLLANVREKYKRSGEPRRFLKIIAQAKEIDAQSASPGFNAELEAAKKARSEAQLNSRAHVLAEQRIAAAMTTLMTVGPGLEDAIRRHFASKRALEAVAADAAELADVLEREADDIDGKISAFIEKNGWGRIDVSVLGISAEVRNFREQHVLPLASTFEAMSRDGNVRNACGDPCWVLLGAGLGAFLQ